MSQTVILAVAAELNESHIYPPPYEAPSGKVWQKTPDVYDQENDIVWEGNWELTEQLIEPVACDPKSCHPTKTTKTILACTCVVDQCKWGCPNGHMGSDHYCYENDGGYESWLNKFSADKIKNQRKTVNWLFNPNYHVCNHETHAVCSGSPCCDLFWHEGDCHFISDDGKCGYAVRFGDQ
jgi:hypothetical protein